MRHLLSCLLALCLSTSMLAGPVVPEPVRGVKVYDPPKDRAATFKAWKELGLNTIWIGGALAKDARFFREARLAGFRTQLVFPVFYNPEALRCDPSLWAIQGNGKRAKDDWVEFVCPSHVGYRRIRILEAQRLLKVLKPDGLSLDFLRCFVFWEMKYPNAHLDPMASACFCPRCVQAFSQAANVRVPAGSVPEQAGWILARAGSAWTEWRCGLITSMTRELAQAARSVRKDLWVNLHVVPWMEADFEGARGRVAAQDVKALGALVDTLSPMVYAPMVKRDSTWVHDVTAELVRLGGKPVLPSIQVKECYLPEVLTPTRFKADLDAALLAPSRGVVFWNWPGLAECAEKRALAK